MEVTKVKVNEIQEALKQLKRGKCQDLKGIAVELLKASGQRVRMELAALCTKLLEGGEIPTSWKKNTIKVLHKLGRQDDADNYRPICSIDITYKLMSRIIDNRIIKRLDEG